MLQADEHMRITPLLKTRNLKTKTGSGKDFQICRSFCKKIQRGESEWIEQRKAQHAKSKE